MDLSKLKEIRKSKRLTQVEVAKAVGVSMTAYQLWERGVMKPNEKNMNKLIKVLSD